MPSRLFLAAGLCLGAAPALSATLVDTDAFGNPYAVYTDRAAWLAAIGTGKTLVDEGFDNPMPTTSLGSTDGGGDINIIGDLVFDSGLRVNATCGSNTQCYNPDPVANDFEIRPDYDTSTPGEERGLLMSIENSAAVDGLTPEAKVQPDEISFTLPLRSDAFGLFIGIGEQSTSQGIGNDSGTRIVLRDNGPDREILSFDVDRLTPGAETDDSLAYVGFIGFVTASNFDSVVFASLAEDGSNDDDFLADNLSFTQMTPPVPVPPALPLLAGAFGLMAYLSRRPRTTA
jgi:hypothetical protein